MKKQYLLVEKDILYLSDRQSSFGATRQEITTFLEKTRQRTLDTSLEGDELDREVSEVLSLLYEAKIEYIKLLNKQSENSELPDYAFYTPETKFEIDSMAKVVLDFYKPIVKEQFSQMELPAKLKVYKGNDIYLYVEIDQNNYEVNRDLAIKQTERSIRNYAGDSYSVRSYYKDTIRGIRTKQSGISVLFHGWVLFNVFVYPIETIKLPQFINVFVEGNQFNQIGEIYTLLVQQHELPHYLYEYEPEQVKRTDIDNILKSLKNCVVNGEQLGIELINKWFPDIFTKRDKQIINNCTIYVLYFADYIGDLVLAGGNSINVKVNSPIVNDLDFIYTGSMTAQEFKKRLTAFAFFIQECSNLKTIEERIHSKVITFKLLSVMIRETRNEKRKSTQFSIDIVFKENGLESKYTLCEFGLFDTTPKIEAVDLIVQFKDRQGKLLIQSAKTDLQKFKNMDIAPRTKSKIERDLQRLKVLISKMNRFSNQFNDKLNCLDFHGELAEYTFELFQKYIDLLYNSPANVPKSEIMFMNPVDKFLMPTPDTVTISKIIFCFKSEKQNLGTLLSKHRTSKQPVEIEILKISQEDINNYKIKIIEKMKKRHASINANKKVNVKAYTQFVKEKVYPMVNLFSTNLVDSFGPNIISFKRLNVLKYLDIKYQTQPQMTIKLLSGDPKILAEEFRVVLLKVLFQEPDTYDEFIEVLHSLVLQFPILNVNEDICNVLENIATLYIFATYATTKNIEQASILKKVAELNIMHMYDVIAVYLQKNLNEADMDFVNKMYK